MIKLTLSDGTRIHVNPAGISYLQPLPDSETTGDKEQPKTKVVLMSGECLSVLQTPNRILAAAGDGRKKKKEHDNNGADE